MKQTLILIILLCIAGCAKPTVLYVIDKEDIMAVRKGETVTAPKDGYFLSAFYVKEVMSASVR